MPNPYFQFKKFTVYHDKCAMKVGTDGLMLGAWVDVKEATKVLDIGTGSGVIALMVAQRCHAMIDAIDISEGAYIQSLENFKSCDWTERLTTFHMGLKDFAELNHGQGYDLIVSNPPYFHNNLKPTKHDRAVARHSIELDLKKLVLYSSRLLAKNGRMCFILPYEQLEQLSLEAKVNQLFLTKLTKVYPKPRKPIKRVLVQLEKSEKELAGDKLIIEGDSGGYSDEYRVLLKEFYLKF